MRRTTPTWPTVAVLAALALTAVACGGGGGSSTGGPVAAGDQIDATRCPVAALDDAEGTVELDFWHAMPAENETTLEALVADYNASQDRVEVNPIFQGTYDETADKLLAAIRGGELPGLVQLEETRIQLALDSRVMLPAEACVQAAEYDLADHIPAVVDQFTVEDVLWPMPFNTSNPVLYYNSQAFEAAGIGEDEVPTTLEELRDVSQRLVEAGVAPAGFAFELQPWYLEQWFSMANEPLVDNDNGRTDRAHEVNLDSELGRELFGWVDEMIDDGLAINVGRNENGIDHFLAVANEQAAMTIGTSAALGTVLATLQSGQFPNVTVGVAPLPGPEGADGGVQVGGGALWLVDRGRSDEQKAAAWDFARWLNEPEQQARWHEGTGYLPIRQAALELPQVSQLWEQTPEYRVAYDQLMASEADLGGPVIGDYGNMREAVIEALERMILEDVPPAEAVTRANERAEEAVQSYNDRIGG